MRKTTILPIFLTIFLSSCCNMPTPPSRITGSYTSDLVYEDLDCKTLSAEYNSLIRRENKLVTAQNQRIQNSRIQAFWWGFGEGDGIEASELADVRGQIEAVLRVMEKKECKNPIEREEPKTNKPIQP